MRCARITLVCLLALSSLASAQTNFFIQSIQRNTNGSVTIRWPVVPRGAFTVLHADSINGPWQSFAQPSLTMDTNTSTFSFTDNSSSTATQQFYKVGVFPRPIIMTLVLDRSGSMLGNGGALELPPAASNFINLFDDNLDHAAMVSFSSAVTTPADVSMRQPFKTDIANAVNALAFGGWTCSEQGLTNALAQNNSVTVTNGNPIKVIVFFTDGVANTWNYTFDCGSRNIAPDDSLYDPITGANANGGCTIPVTLPSINGGTLDPTSCLAMHTEAEARAEQIASLARLAGNTIYSVGLRNPGGFGECGGILPLLNTNFLKNVANTPDSATYDPTQPVGDYVIASDASHLNQLFQEIATKMLQ